MKRNTDSGSDHFTLHRRKMLFTLYKKLISPVRKIEQLTAAIQDNEYEIEGKKAYEGETPGFFVYLFRFFIFFFGLYTMIYLFQDVLPDCAGYLYLPAVFFCTIVPVKIRYRISSSITRSRYNNHDIPKLENEIKDYEDQRNEIVLAIKDYICYCPPAYRYSSALSYFVDSYLNTRVSNLQEAVRTFDEHKRSQDMMNAMRCIYSVLGDIKAA